MDTPDYTGKSDVHAVECVRGCLQLARYPKFRII